MLSYGFVTTKFKKQKSPHPKFDFCFHQNIACATSILMITIQTRNFNHISQDFYNKTINSLDLNLIPCTCGHSGCLIRHGSYRRTIRFSDNTLSFSVVRVYCKECGHTHALLLSSMVPYSQFPLAVHISIINADTRQNGFQSVLEEQYCMDENNLKSIVRSFRLHWRERLRSQRFSLADITALVFGCFSCFSRQFMQIKTTPNKLFVPPT